MDLKLPEPLHSFMDGLERKAVTNFYGAPGTGKTNLCLLVAADCARRGGRVVFIDTEGGFSLERLKQIAPQDYENLLKNIELVEPKSLKEQTEAVRRLGERNPNLVIMDSSVALYRVECAEGADKENARPEKSHVMKANQELSKQLAALSTLARVRGIPVLITTHAFRSWDDGSYDAVGGDALKYWSKALIFLERTGKTSERRAVLIKHRSQPEGKTVKFVITQEGIGPSGFRLF